MPPFTVPYGILSLDAYLKRQCGHQVSCYIVDLNITLKNIVDSVEKQDCFTAFSASLTAAIHDFEPSMIGISALFNICLLYTSACRRRVAGGRAGVPASPGVGTGRKEYLSVAFAKSGQLERAYRGI